MDRRSGFEAVFLDPVRQPVQQRWADAAMTMGFEELPAVSAFPVIPGRRWGPDLVRSWVPQLFARHRDGTGLLADCPSATRRPVANAR